MRVRHIVTAFVAVTSTFTADADAQRRPNVQELGRAFTMKIGQRIRVNDLELRFRSVVDNRCRAGDMCITAGNATINLEVNQGANASVISLHTMVDPHKIEWNRYSIRLVRLSGPLRTPIPLEKQYRAEILVTR